MWGHLKTAQQAQALYLAAGIGTFLTLLVLGWTLNFHKPLATTATVPTAREWYLGYYRAEIDHYVLYHNLSHAAEPLKTANVVFLGSSRALFALPQETLQPFFEKRGLRYFVLAFGYGEGMTFPNAIIEKYDLHPKWVVVNPADFFTDQISPFAKTVMASSAFDAVKFRFETCASFDVQRMLHIVVPELTHTQSESRPDWIWYRSYQDGTIRLAAVHGVETPVKSLEGRGSGTPATPIEDQIARARQFKTEMEKRGAKLVLMRVPPVSLVEADVLARELGVPLLSPDVADLMTCDKTHLTPDSAQRYCAAMLQKFQQVLDLRE